MSELSKAALSIPHDAVRIQRLEMAILDAMTELAEMHSPTARSVHHDLFDALHGRPKQDNRALAKAEADAAF